MGSISHQVVTEQHLNEDLTRLLDNIDAVIDADFHGKCSKSYQDLFRSCLEDGLRGLLGQITIPKSKAWTDAIQYSRAVILKPRDDEERAASLWSRSVSEPQREALTLYGPAVVEAARFGAKDIIERHFDGDARSVPHINKKASFKRHCHEIETAAGYSPSSNPLIAACYEIGAVGCSLAMAAWFTPEQAVRMAMVSHISMSDDYSGFTGDEYAVRMRLVAVSLGAAYHTGERGIRGFMDGLGSKAIGTSSARTVEAAMTWRAVSGDATQYSKYVLEPCSMNEALLSPEVAIAVHDLTDWRSDVAAGNFENGVMAVYGMGIAAPFHAYVEAILRRALRSPSLGLHAIASMIIMAYTSTRYAAYEYQGSHQPGCPTCMTLLQELTAKAGYEWEPVPPPKTFEESREASRLGKLWVEQLVDQGLIQMGISWFQHLISTGGIWVFDALAQGAEHVDAGTDWM